MGLDRTADSDRGRTTGLGADELRLHNLGAILEILHLGGPTTRSELTARTGLNRSTIARLIGELAEAGIVSESYTGTRTGPGRPSPLVAPEPSRSPALAMEVTLDLVSAALVGLGGEVLARAEVAGDWAAVSARRTAGALARLAGPLLEEAGDDLIGAAVAIPGIVRQEDGFVHLAPNLGWSDVAFGELLGSGLDAGVPVTVGNEANLGAFAEHRRELPDVDDLVYVHTDVGIGVGIIAGGSPLTGAHGYASEGGHMVVRPDGAACRCGSAGCWETEIGEEALLRATVGEAPAPGRVAVDALVRRLEDEEPRAVEGLEGVGRWLGVGIANLANLFDPEVVVVGGVYGRLFPWLEDALRVGLAERALEPIANEVRVVPSTIEPDAPLVGAAEVALAAAIDQPLRFPALRRSAR